MSQTTVTAVAGRGVDVTGGSGNVFERLDSRGNRTGLALTDSTPQRDPREQLHRQRDHRRAAVRRHRQRRRSSTASPTTSATASRSVEGANGNTIAANAVDGSQTGLIVDAAHRNLLTLNTIDGAGDGVLIAGDRTRSRSTLVDRSVGGCEGCSGWGIGVTSGAGNVVKANVVQRSAGDGIHVAAPGTWIGLNVALRSGGWGILAVAGVRDGGLNRAERCSGVRCR